MRCPVCRQLTKAFNLEDVKANGNEAVTILIPTNDVLIAVINQQLAHDHPVVHCDNCEEGQVQAATVRCIPCAVYFCDDCFRSAHAGKVRLKLRP
jgi:hypothetical protein